MTREQAIHYLERIKQEYDCSYEEDALDMAIKALEQEPCEDAISREDALMALTGEWTEITDEIIHRFIRRIKMLPSVKPQTGHWEMPVQDDGMSEPIYYQVRCSKCGFDLDPQTWHMELHQYDADKYCPKCGARMEVEQHG